MLNLLKNQYYTLSVNFQSKRTGKTVQYQILNYNLAVLQDYTATGVVELGQGSYGVRLSFSTAFCGFIRWKDVEDNIILTDAITIIEDWISQIAMLYKIETGRWKIIANQMIFYDTDGTTPLLTFDLKDSAGAPTMVAEDIVERTPV